MGGLGLGSREGVRDPAVRSREAGGGESVPLASKLPLEMAQVAVVLCSSVSTEPFRSARWPHKKAEEIPSVEHGVRAAAPVFNVHPLDLPKTNCTCRPAPPGGYRKPGSTLTQCCSV